MNIRTTDSLPPRRTGLARTCLLPLLGVVALAACGDDGAGTGGGSTGSSTSGATTTAGSSTVTTGGEGGGGEGGAGGQAPVTCSSDSPQALAACVDEAAYAADLGFVADVRPPGSPHWQAVQDLCADRLEEYGFEVLRDDYGTGVNVIGRRLGSSAPGETVVIGAHYDHIPDCPGADDNASGVAAALEMARILAETDFERTLLVGFWDEEELGLIGAAAYVSSEVADADGIVVNFNFDSIGYRTTDPDTQSVPNGFDSVFPEAYDQVEANDFRGDFIAIITNESAVAHASTLAGSADRIGLAQTLLAIPAGFENTSAFADLRRSDHAVFWEADYPAVFLTDTANFRNDHYHCIGGPDVVDDIDVPFAADVTRITVEAAAVALGMP